MVSDNNVAEAETKQEGTPWSTKSSQPAEARGDPYCKLAAGLLVTFSPFTPLCTQYSQENPAWPGLLHLSLHSKPTKQAMGCGECPLERRGSKPVSETREGTEATGQVRQAQRTPQSPLFSLAVSPVQMHSSHSRDLRVKIQSFQEADWATQHAKRPTFFTRDPRPLPNSLETHSQRGCPDSSIGTTTSLWTIHLNTTILGILKISSGASPIKMAGYQVSPSLPPPAACWHALCGAARKGSSPGGPGTYVDGLDCTPSSRPYPGPTSRLQKTNQQMGALSSLPHTAPFQ